MAETSKPVKEPSEEMVTAGVIAIAVESRGVEHEPDNTRNSTWARDCIAAYKAMRPLEPIENDSEIADMCVEIGSLRDIPETARQLLLRAADALRSTKTMRSLESSTEPVAFQQRVYTWMLACFGEQIAQDGQERNHRFLEESIELMQACDGTASEAHQLVDYVFGRPIGEKKQEVGGVMVTLAALCAAHGVDMDACGNTELARVWTKIDVIRDKQAAKPKHSPLPETTAHPVDAPIAEPVVDGVSAEMLAAALLVFARWATMPPLSAIEESYKAMRGMEKVRDIKITCPICDAEWQQAIPAPVDAPIFRAIPPETLEIAERKAEAQKNDTRTDEQKIRDSGKFILGPDYPVDAPSVIEPTQEMINAGVLECSSDSNPKQEQKIAAIYKRMRRLEPKPAADPNSVIERCAKVLDDLQLSCIEARNNTKNMPEQRLAAGIASEAHHIAAKAIRALEPADPEKQ